jgi:putative FmdB family regulatory protein
MPTYSYRCEKCGEKFDRIETMSEHEAAKPQCRSAVARKSQLCLAASTS